LNENYNLSNKLMDIKNQKEIVDLLNNKLNKVNDEKEFLVIDLKEENTNLKHENIRIADRITIIHSQHSENVSKLNSQYEEVILK
jgi:hypothetical protein